MKLKPTEIKIKTGHLYFAVLHKDTADKYDLHVGDRVLLTNGRNKVTAILEVSENRFPKNQTGLFTETYDKLKIKKGDKVTLCPANKPASVEFIRKKLDGVDLNANEIDSIIKDVVNEDLSPVELTYFVSACYTDKLSDKETVALTKAIVKHGEKLTFKKKIIADKHCIGGVPGNRTTMMVIPIVTAAGVTMPKTSSRAITSPAGTADTMEVLCNVTNDAKRLKQIANKIGGFITWGGGVDLAAADDKMIRVRHPLSLDPEGMLLASIMAKKHSVSANRVIIDIPMGKQGKVKNKVRANHLRKRFLTIGKMLGMKMEVIITSADKPIGKGIGPALEAIDVLNTLQNKPSASLDLRDKSLYMAGILLELTGKAKKGKGKKMATEILDSGKAHDQFMRILKAQGVVKPFPPKPGRYKKDIKATQSGKIKETKNKMIARIARLAGAPKSPGGGLWLEKNLGDKVKKGDVLFTIYTESKEAMKYTVSFCKKNCPYIIK